MRTAHIIAIFAAGLLAVYLLAFQDQESTDREQIARTPVATSQQPIPTGPISLAPLTPAPIEITSAPESQVSAPTRTAVPTNAKPGLLLSGHVYLANGNPVTNVAVQLATPGFSLAAVTTDRTGAFEIYGNEDTNEFSLSFTKKNYIPLTTKPFERGTTDLAITMQRFGHLSGTIESDPKMLASYNLQLVSAGLPVPTKFDKQQARLAGEIDLHCINDFEFKDLKPSLYDLHVYRRNGDYLIRSILDIDVVGGICDDERLRPLRPTSALDSAQIEVAFEGLPDTDPKPTVYLSERIQDDSSDQGFHRYTWAASRDGTFSMPLAGPAPRLTLESPGYQVYEFLGAPGVTQVTLQKGPTIRLSLIHEPLPEGAVISVVLTPLDFLQGPTAGTLHRFNQIIFSREAILLSADSSPTPIPIGGFGQYQAEFTLAVTRTQKSSFRYSVPLKLATILCSEPNQRIEVMLEPDDLTKALTYAGVLAR